MRFEAERNETKDLFGFSVAKCTRRSSKMAAALAAALLLRALIPSVDMHHEH